jgi:hypothetical protein
MGRSEDARGLPHDGPATLSAQSLLVPAPPREPERPPVPPPTDPSQSPLEEMVESRRKKLGQTDPAVWGLALSGGGIRSATFCFGLLSALARNGSLLRFDLLSTVSGGGYIGAACGRLFERATSVDDLRRIVAVLGEGNTSWFAWWLRANGRYLVPRGISDTLSAIAVYLRNFIGVHVELGIAGLLLGSLLAGFDLLAWYSLERSIPAEWPGWLDAIREGLAWLPTPWLLLGPLTFAAVVAILAYWSIPLAGRPYHGVAGIVAAVVGCALLLLFRDGLIGPPGVAGHGARLVVWLFGMALTMGWSLAVPIALWLNRPHSPTERGAPGSSSRRAALHAAMTERTPSEVQDDGRNRTTEWLSWLLKAIGVVLLLGLMDRVAWWFAFDFGDWLQAGTWLAVTAAVLRALMPFAVGLQNKGAGVASLIKLGDALGRLLTFCVFGWWVAVVHATALGSLFRTSTGDGLDWRAAAIAVALILAMTLAYAMATGWHVRFLNLSSLHGFYRARLVRSYLGAANPARFFDPKDRDALGGSLAPSPLGAVERLPTNPDARLARKVWEVHPDDDTPICRYAPHLHGGPVHLINACVNQTKDPRGGMFNRDRRGQLVTIAPKGHFHVGGIGWYRLDDSDPGSLTLGSWTAISGAAIAPGLGSQTRGGISALAMFVGARLGYWWDSSPLKREGIARRLHPAKLWSVGRETIGYFPGTQALDWFITDGGHFENTGAYALLAERCDVVVLADCGADPQYRFRDLENLVRKARIDLRAEIEFLRPRAVRPQEALSIGESDADEGTNARRLLSRFGSLNDLTSSSSRACFALARIVYRDEVGGRQTERQGHLVLVKPNLFEGLPVDLFNFKAEHPEFPQQATADQFFDEAQWESYFQLGRAMVEPLDKDALRQLLRHYGKLFTVDDGSPVPARAPSSSAAAPPTTSASATLNDGPQADADRDASGRLPERLANTTVAAASIGLGAAVTMGVAAWQAIDSVRKSAEEQTKAERAALKELTDLWAKLPSDRVAAASSTTAGELAAALARVSDTLCPAQEADWFNRSPLAVDILQGARDACDRAGDNSRACNWLLNASDPFAAGPRASCLAVGSELAERRNIVKACTQYWGWDYRRNAWPDCAHPTDPLGMARRKEASDRRRQFEVLPAADPLPDLAMAAAVKRGPCVGLTVYPMLYGTEEKERADGYRKAWQQAGVRIAATEDLVAKARVLRLTAPVPPKFTRVRYHDASAAACVQQLVGKLDRAVTQDWRIENATPLSPGKPGGIEVWVVARPPTAPAAADRASRPASVPSPTTPPTTTSNSPSPASVPSMPEPAPRPPIALHVAELERLLKACAPSSCERRCPSPPPKPQPPPSSASAPPPASTTSGIAPRIRPSTSPPAIRKPPAGRSLDCGDSQARPAVVPQFR